MTARVPSRGGTGTTVPVPTTRRYLMCPPRYFAVKYAINPWMDPARGVDVDRAIAQWTALRDTYRRLGHTVEEIEPQPGLPDMVFAANSAIVVDGRVLGARFLAPQRAPEAKHYRRWFSERGYRDVVTPTAINEGEGDFVWTGRMLLAGTGFRTEPAAHAEAGETLGVPVLSLRLVDPRYYHLDTALVVLSEATESAPARIAYYPEAFSPGARRALARFFPDAILADAVDAERFGLNAVSDGRNVVLPADAEGFADKLAAHGYVPVPVAVSEFRKSGGGPKCCTLEIRK